MASYLGYHADLYDLFYSGKPYRKEAAMILKHIRRYHPGKPKKILEIACGTGSHSFHLAKKDFSIVATDNSKDMLRMARQKLSPFNNVVVAKMDMLRFRKFREPFDVVLCLFDSIGYVRSNENVLAVLKNIHQSLSKKGIFIFEYWNAGAMLRSYEPFRLKEWKQGDTKVIRKSNTRLRYDEQLCDVTYSIEEYHRSALKHKISEKQTNRFFLTQEMNYFLTTAGFTPLASFDGYSSRNRITEDTWHTVCIARKK